MKRGFYSIPERISVSKYNTGTTRLTKHRCRGFTLIELLVSIAVIGILTGIVIVKYGSFDSTILLKSTAYEIGLNLREAQVRSVSAVRGTSGFDKPFGVSFDLDSKKQYIVFSEGATVQDPPIFDPGEEIQTVLIGRNMELSELCVTRSGNSDDCSARRVDISFKRPEYKSRIYAKDGLDPIPNVTDARIKINSTNGANTFVISVSQLGQINVKAE